MKVIINHQGLELDEKDVLGVGGEALVLRYGRQAIKLYHQPGPQRAARLQNLLELHPPLPTGVMYPHELVYDRRGKQVLGFTMSLTPPQSAPLASLGHKVFRTTHGINPGQVANLFLKIHLNLQEIHRAGLLVGDLNDLNLLFEGTEPFFIDVDSYQFGTYPCPVATELYLDPQLYGLNLSAKPYFQPEHDWYSFAVLLFRSLLLVHPYGGTHPRLKRLTQRAVQRLTVLDSAVTYPRVGLNPQLLNDELGELFYRIFGQGWRGVFPAAALAGYAAELQECAVCRQFFPASRRFCPVCHPVSQFQAVGQPISAGIVAEELLAGSGPIIAFQSGNDRVACLYREENAAVVYLLEQATPPAALNCSGGCPGHATSFLISIC